MCLQDGYDTASIQYFRDHAIPSEKLTDLIVLHQKVHYKASKWIRSLNPNVLDEVERLLGPMPRVEKNWASLPDGPAWTWWLIPIFPLSPQLQVNNILFCDFDCLTYHLFFLFRLDFCEQQVWKNASEPSTKW